MVQRWSGLVINFTLHVRWGGVYLASPPPELTVPSQGGRLGKGSMVNVQQGDCNICLVRGNGKHERDGQRASVPSSPAVMDPGHRRLGREGA
ncbi:hypothetical protein LX36DRAFT_106103 [Colletotrichum falcatum]|nr:hypothetical protein LX36DRAFT_106103 [Colletotrichum falcatum]